MPWIALSTVFLGATFKFLVSPALGPVLDLTYFQTFFANAAGAIVSMVFFYFSADLLIRYNHKRKVKKHQLARQLGEKIERKKIFTRRNKLIVRMKNKIGFVPFALWAPLFLSIPIGSIITAKFFGKKRTTLWVMIAGVFLNNTLTVSLVYLLKNNATALL